MEKMDLIQRWRKLYRKSEVQSVQNTYRDILDRYSESHRHYHTIDHVAACLLHLDSVEHVDNRRDLEMALWFHDVIYDPLKKDNEEKSAIFSCDALIALGESEQVIDRVRRLIILTKHPSDPKEQHEKLLIDIDLSILGSSEGIYEHYERWIRKEYSQVPAILFRRGRKKVLRSFLDQPRIYSTEEFNEKYEATARRNLTNALRQL